MGAVGGQDRLDHRRARNDRTKLWSKRYCEEGAMVIASDRPDMENVDEILRTLGDGIRYFGATSMTLPAPKRP